MGKKKKQKGLVPDFCGPPLPPPPTHVEVTVYDAKQGGKEKTAGEKFPDPAKLFSKEFLLAVKVGDIVATEGPMQGLSAEPVLWKLIEKRSAQSLKVLNTFEGSYFGIYFGQLAADIMVDGTVEVRDL